ncbi:MAG: hypothetical protein JWQ62_868 [Lacunisphaera sp.]|nr:hypothetical protein [Lacunisphaera sp.]
MKSTITLVSFLLLGAMSSAQTPLPGDRPGPTPAGQQGGTVPSPAAPAAQLTSDVYVWDKLPVIPNAKGARRAVLDGPTTTLDKLHCHITTLNAGEKSGEPSLHLQEEIIIVKEGTLEAVSDGVARVAPAGSVIFFAAHSVTYMRNVGTTPATYTVVYYYTPLTPKS